MTRDDNLHEVSLPLNDGGSSNGDPNDGDEGG